jgi:phosphopantetheine adenylyltransferase
MIKVAVTGGFDPIHSGHREVTNKIPESAFWNFTAGSG